MTAALLIARKFWPVLAALAVLAALWGWGNSRYRDGVQTEREKWQAVAAAQALQAAENAARQQAAVNAANTAATAARASLDALASRTKETAHAYYRDRPAIACLSDERLRAIKDADASAEAAATTE